MTSIRNRFASVYQNLGGRKKSTIKHEGGAGLVRLNTMHGATSPSNSSAPNDVHDKPWGNDMRHKFDVISEQVDRGLGSLAGAISYVEKLLSYATANDPTKLAKTRKQEDEKDEMHNFSDAIEFLQTTLFTHITAEHAFMLAVRAKVLEPLQQFYKDNVKLKKDIDKQGWGKLLDKRAAAKANLEKVGQDAWLVIHAQNAIHKDLMEGVGDNAKDRAKLTQQFKAQQEKTLKAITGYQKEWEQVNALEVEVERIEEAIGELQTIERNRLKSDESVRTKSESLDPKTQLDAALDSWVHVHGAPPAYSTTRYGLPIMPDEVMAVTGEIPTVLEEEEEPPAEHKDTPKSQSQSSQSSQHHHTSSHSNQPKSGQVCEECDGGNGREVSVRCDDCDQWLCKQCSNKLHSKGTRIGHKYMTLERKSASSSIASNAAADLANSIPPLTPSASQTHHTPPSSTAPLTSTLSSSNLTTPATPSSTRHSKGDLSSSSSSASASSSSSSSDPTPTSPPRRLPPRNAVATPFAMASPNLPPRLTVAHSTERVDRGGGGDAPPPSTTASSTTPTAAQSAAKSDIPPPPPEENNESNVHYNSRHERREKGKSCDECEDNDDITVFCPECDEFLCKKCSTKLHAKGLRATHPLEPVGGGNSRGSNSSEPSPGGDGKKRTSSQESLDGAGGGGKKMDHHSVDPMFRILSKHQTQTLTPKIAAAAAASAMITSNKINFVDPSAMQAADVCDECKDSERPVIARCNECDKWFCRKCNLKTHQTGGLKENHEIMSLKAKVMSPD